MSYITLAELRDYLGETVGYSDTDLLVAIAAADAMADEYMGRSLALLTTTETVRGTDATVIFPKRTPIVAVASCTVDGEAVDVTHNETWVRRKDGGYFTLRQAIVLNYTGGLAVIPADVKLAIKITAQAALDAGDLDANMTGESGAVSGSYQPGGPGSLPRAAQTILAPKRRTWS